jgi:hypothetical protein
VAFLDGLSKCGSELLLTHEAPSIFVLIYEYNLEIDKLSTVHSRYHEDLEDFVEFVFLLRCHADLHLEVVKTSIDKLVERLVIMSL